MRRRRSRPMPRAEVNVASLVDVAFTLLVIFIMTAPALQGGVEVDLPRADVRAITAQDRPFIVSIQRDGSIFVGETRVEADEFVSAFPQLVEAAGVEMVYVRGDSASVWGTGVQVMAAIANAGVRFGVVAEPDGGR